MTELSRRIFGVCVCGDPLPVRTAEHATCVHDGRPVCHSCYVRLTAGADSDFDAPQPAPFSILGVSPAP